MPRSRLSYINIPYFTVHSSLNHIHRFSEVSLVKLMERLTRNESLRFYHGFPIILGTLTSKCMLTPRTKSQNPPCDLQGHE
jgi:hypothetical protein